MAPEGLTQVFTGTEVHLMLLSGNVIDRQTYGMDGVYSVTATMEVTILSLVFVRVISRFLAIPEECIQFVWRGAQATESNANVHEVVVLIFELDEFRAEEADARTEACTEQVCFCCYWPCADADLDIPNSRHLNCTMCVPCFLCPECRSYVANGDPRCMLCLVQDDVPYLLQGASRRDIIRYRVLTGQLEEQLDWADTAA